MTSTRGPAPGMISRTCTHRWIYGWQVARLEMNTTAIKWILGVADTDPGAFQRSFLMTGAPSCRLAAVSNEFGSSPPQLQTPTGEPEGSRKRREASNGSASFKRVWFPAGGVT